MFQELYYKAITHESYTEKYLPHFVFTLLALVSAGEVGTGWIPMSKLSLFDHNFVWANLRPVETICKTAKKTQGKNNPVYSMSMQILTRPHLSLQTIDYSKQYVASIVRSCYKPPIFLFVYI